MPVLARARISILRPLGDAMLRVRTQDTATTRVQQLNNNHNNQTANSIRRANPQVSSAQPKAHQDNADELSISKMCGCALCGFLRRWERAGPATGAMLVVVVVEG